MDFNKGAFSYFGTLNEIPFYIWSLKCIETLKLNFKHLRAISKYPIASIVVTGTVQKQY